MMQPMRSPSDSYHVTTTSAHNGAAILSVVCAALWPLSFLIPVLVNATTSGPRSAAASLPMFVDFLLACGFGLLPVVGVAVGSLGLYRAMSQPALRRTRWIAITGIVLNCLWFFGTFLLSDLGPAIVYWFQHL
jgi:hypothetical protein